MSSVGVSGLRAVSQIDQESVVLVFSFDFFHSEPVNLWIMLKRNRQSFANNHLFSCSEKLVLTSATFLDKLGCHFSKWVLWVWSVLWARLCSKECNQSQRERSTKTLSHPGLIICALGLHVWWIYLPHPPSYLHLQSQLSITGDPNEL